MHPYIYYKLAPKAEIDELIEKVGCTRIHFSNACRGISKFSPKMAEKIASELRGLVSEQELLFPERYPCKPEHIAPYLEILPDF